MSATVIFIHGANSSSISFNYIKVCCRLSQVENFDYSINDRFFDNLNQMSDRLTKINGPVFFVAHSLGGIFAMLLADRFSDKTLGAVTISTPYGGSATADFIKFLVPNNHFLREIGPHAAPIEQARAVKIRWPWINIVTTRGNVPWIMGCNDGVVTQDSMRNHEGLDTVDIATNHHEIMLHDQTIAIIKERLNGIFSG